MQLPPTEPETAHLGAWLTRRAILDLIPAMAAHYFRRFKSLTISDRDDLAQSATLAVLEWEAANGQIERMRELTAIGLLHRAMVADVRANRKQSAIEGLPETPERDQLTDKQAEMINLFVMHASKAARKPTWEMVFLRKSLGWSEQAISDYFRRKKDERQYWSPEQVGKMVTAGVQRIKRKVPPDIILDLRMLASYA